MLVSAGEYFFITVCVLAQGEELICTQTAPRETQIFYYIIEQSISLSHSLFYSLYREKMNKCLCFALTLYKIQKKHVAFIPFRE